MNSLDASYEMMFMGLWTWAEITTGILISCLPITPKFFQYAGPKVRRMFPASMRQRPESATVKDNAEVSVPMERRPERHNVGRDHSGTLGAAANDPTGCQAHHIPLSSLDMAVSEEAVKNGRQSVLVKEIVARLRDLESGRL